MSNVQPTTRRCYRLLTLTALLALAGCTSAPEPPATSAPAPTAVQVAQPTAAPKPTSRPQTGLTIAPTAVAPTAPIPTVAPAVPVPTAAPATALPAAPASFAPPTATPLLPEPTVGADNVAALRPLRTFGLGGPRKVAIAPGSKLLAVATTAGVALFELPSLRHLRFDPIEGGARALAWSPDGQQLAIAAHAQGAGDNTEVRRVVDGVTLATLAGGEPAWGSDGRTIATQICDTAGCRTTRWRSDGGGAVNDADTPPPDGSDGTLIATDNQTTTEIRRSPNGDVVRTLPGGLSAWSHDQQLLAVSDGSRVEIWRRQDLLDTAGKPARTLTPPGIQPAGYGNALSFSADDRALHAVLGNRLFTWRVADGALIGDVADMAAEIVGFEANGEVLNVTAVGGDGPAITRLIRTSDGSTLYDGAIGDISFGDDNATIVLFPFGGPVQLLRLDGGKGAQLDLPEFTGVAFSPDAQTLAASTRTNVSLWNVVDGALQQVTQGSLPGYAFFDDVYSIRVRYGVDGRLLTYEAARENIYEGVSASAIAWDVTADGAPVRNLQSQFLQRSDQARTQFVWAFSAGTDASAFSYDGRQVELSPRDGVTITVTSPISVTALEFSPDGTLLAIGDQAGTVRLVKTSDGSAAQTFQAGGTIQALAFSPDGALLAAPRADGTAPVWRLGQPSPLATLAAVPNESKLIFTADNQMAIAGSAGGVALYSLPGGQLLHTLPIACDDIAIGPRKRLLAVLHDGRVILWGVSSSG